MNVFLVKKVGATMLIIGIQLGNCYLKYFQKILEIFLFQLNLEAP